MLIFNLVGREWGEKDKRNFGMKLKDEGNVRGKNYGEWLSHGSYSMSYWFQWGLECERKEGLCLWDMEKAVFRVLTRSFSYWMTNFVPASDLPLKCIPRSCFESAISPECISNRYSHFSLPHTFPSINRRSTAPLCVPVVFLAKFRNSDQSGLSWTWM